MFPPSSGLSIDVNVTSSLPRTPRKRNLNAFKAAAYRRPCKVLSSGAGSSEWCTSISSRCQKSRTPPFVPDAPLTTSPSSLALPLTANSSTESNLGASRPASTIGWAWLDGVVESHRTCREEAHGLASSPITEPALTVPLVLLSPLPSPVSSSVLKASQIYSGHSSLEPRSDSDAIQATLLEAIVVVVLSSSS